MNRYPIKIAVAGTHSTGKTTFLDGLEAALKTYRLRIGRIGGLALRARQLGFPILTEHTFESTLWLMAECLRQEAENSLSCDIILIDRPLLDTLAYLRAALEMSQRSLRPGRLEELTTIAPAHTNDYDLLEQIPFEFTHSLRA